MPQKNYAIPNNNLIAYRKQVLLRGFDPHTAQHVLLLLSVADVMGFGGLRVESLVAIHCVRSRLLARLSAPHDGQRTGLRV